MEKKRIVYTPQGGVCSRMMIVDVADGKVEQAQVIGGCDGNLKGVCSLIKGLPVEEVIHRLEGIDCKGKGTSCPDQMARALKESIG